MKNKIILGVVTLLILIFGVGKFVLYKKTLSMTEPTTSTNIGGLEQATATFKDDTNNGTTFSKNREVEVQHIKIPKESFEGGVKDLELSVGDTYGNFTISKIIDRKGHGPNVVEFTGEEIVKGSLGFSGIGAFFLGIDDTEKVPQIFEGIYDHPVIVNTFVANDPIEMPPHDFVFEPDKTFKPVEVKITHLRLIIPTIDAFGSVDINVLRFAD